MFFGTVSGGLSAELADGNFWQGAATGLVVSGLNHVAHKMQNLGVCPTCPKNPKVGQTFKDEAGTNWEYTQENGWMAYIYSGDVEPIALGSGGMIEYIGGGGPIKGVQWLSKMVKKYPGSATTATQIGENIGNIQLK